MKAYVSVSYSNRQSLNYVIAAITESLSGFSIEAFVFVDHYQFNIEDEKQMMQQAMVDIDSADFLIAETSYKAIGIGVEAGYAIAKGKPVIYMRQQYAAHSTTVSGISNYHIVYADAVDLKQQLISILSNITRTLQQKK